MSYPSWLYVKKDMTDVDCFRAFDFCPYKTRLYWFLNKYVLSSISCEYIANSSKNFRYSLAIFDMVYTPNIGDNFTINKKTNSSIGYSTVLQRLITAFQPLKYNSILVA